MAEDESPRPEENLPPTPSRRRSRRPHSAEGAGDTSTVDTPEETPAEEAPAPAAEAPAPAAEPQEVLAPKERRGCGGLGCGAAPRVCLGRVDRQYAHPLRDRRLDLRLDGVGGHRKGLDPEIARKVEYLDGTLEGSGLVYVATTSEARRVSELLNEAGIKASYYHGQMRKSDRDRVQQAWMDEITPVVVATTAFGMGINKPNLRYVVHYDLPASLEAYYQEAGRAGRDGEPARAILIYDPRDRNIQSFFIGGSVPSETSLRDLWDDIRKVIRTKERDNRADGADGKVHTLSIGEVAKIRNLPMARVRPLLAALEQAGGVALLSGNGDNHDVATFRKLHVPGRRLLLDMKKLQARKQYEQSRLDMMLRYASTRDCRRKLLLGYFGEEYNRENCGACDNCIKANEVDIGACGAALTGGGGAHDPLPHRRGRYP